MCRAKAAEKVVHIESFDKPIVTGVDRTDSGLTLYIYNVTAFDLDAFNAKYGNTIFVG